MSLLDEGETVVGDGKAVMDRIIISMKELDERAVELAVAEALASDVSPEAVIQQGLSPAMKEIGDSFEAGTLFLPELLVAADMFKAGLELVRPRLAAGAWEDACTVVIGTVQGDVHDIGKNIVKMMLETAGFDVVDLGVDVQPDDFVAAARESGARIIAASSLLSSTMPNLKVLIDVARASDLDVGVMVGGAPVTASLAETYGADGFAPDAVAAVDAAKRLSRRS